MTCPTTWNDVLRAVARGGRADIVDGFASALPDLCAAHAISTPLRQAHFVAQCAHESAGFTAIVERGNGAYLARYDGRKTLGNTQLGDGARFRGRGLIQLTGRANYRKFGALLGVDLVGDPDRAAAFPIAAQTAACFWRHGGLNALADRDDLGAVTRAINGGLNGLASRAAFLRRAKAAIPRLAAHETRARPAAGQSA